MDFAEPIEPNNDDDLPGDQHDGPHPEEPRPDADPDPDSDADLDPDAEPDVDPDDEPNDEPDTAPDPDGDSDDDPPFEFPNVFYAHEDPDDPLCVAGMERNARDLVVADLACPAGVADVDDHLARIAPRLGLTYAAGLDYCDVGVMLERLPRLQEMLEARPFLPFSHVKCIARAVIPLADEHLDVFCDRLLRYLAPRKSGQALVGYKSLCSSLCRIIGEIQPLAKPDDPDEQPTPVPSEDPNFNVDERSTKCTTMRVTLRADEGREAIAIIDAIARAHGCGRREALMHALRGTAKEVRVAFNIYRAMEGGPAWMSGPGWLDAVATEEWTKRATHVRLSSNGSTEGYVPTEAMAAFIEGRDGVCRFPMCDNPAHRDDKDHVANYNHENPKEGGPTSTANVHCLCRRHHNVKTSKLWDVEAHPDGSEVWTSADGEHRFVTMPQGPLAGFGRKTFDARATRLTATRHEHNARRIAEEEEAKRVTEEAQSAAMEKWKDLYGPDASGPEADLSYEEKREQFPDVPPF
ncbi:HNH endonuclease signature motif containing protein [uncultured Corynebacterium sp.]|uniref:HNH endonuclease signature motif containing protein n=1 Tax=uncultured Corynebacterium sp. TaxID=159447 RepID=UPI0025F25F10|nr:HNH endonuclease signature motif containing protein [uncultured Corynebacterium sp.]